MSEEKEIKLPIDTSLGKLPQKTKGSIVPVQFWNLKIFHHSNAWNNSFF